ncbi:hypothetical protein E4U21_005822 [Claviceps maximensis]|nr:hypothetical protein E4U21_005822 [Claviceps maximensis]
MPTTSTQSAQNAHDIHTTNMQHILQLAISHPSCPSSSADASSPLPLLLAVLLIILLIAALATILTTTLATTLTNPALTLSRLRPPILILNPILILTLAF